MLKSTILKSTYEEIYRRWDEHTPVPFDCGKICGAACCVTDGGQTMGIYLLPGEEKVHDKKDSWLTWSMDKAQDYDFPEAWRGKVPFVACQGPAHCKREKRPIQCRTFPLRPYLTREDELIMIYDEEALPYACPLIENEVALDEGFIRVCYENWRILISDPLIRDIVKMDSEGLAEVTMVPLPVQAERREDADRF